MSEGEFYRRLRESQYIEDSSIVSSYEMEKLFNEAKAEFYKKVGFSDAKHLHDYIAYHKNIGDIDDGLIESLEWFVKWFGETQEGAKNSS